MLGVSIMESFKKNFHLWFCGLIAAVLFGTFGVGAMHPAAMNGADIAASTTASAQP